MAKKPSRNERIEALMVETRDNLDDIERGIHAMKTELRELRSTVRELVKARNRRG